MKQIIIGLLALISLSAFADGPIKELSCSGKGVSYTIVLTSEFAPGSKILSNVAVTKFRVNPNGTGRIESEEEGLFKDQIFDSASKALKFFQANDVVLENNHQSLMVLSVKKMSLSVLNLESKIATTLICK